MDSSIDFLKERDPAFYRGRNEDYLLCGPPNMIPTNGIWLGESMLQYPLPLLIVQILVIFIFHHAIHFFLKPLRQPRIVSQIVAGLVLGPSGLGRIRKTSTIGTYLKNGKQVELVENEAVFWTKFFPVKNMSVLETLANVGIIYFMFIIGIETDFSILRRTRKKSVIVALASVGMSFLPAFALSMPGWNLINIISKGQRLVSDQVVFLGAIFNLTAFPLIARILTKHKFLNTELGRLAMSSAIIADIFSWIILSMRLISNGVYLHNYRVAGRLKSMGEPAVNDIISMYTPLYMATWGVFFIFFCVYVIRPAIIKLIRRNPNDDKFSNTHIGVILAGVMTCALFTDSIGMHPISGAFVFGLIIPNGPLAVALVEKIEHFMCGLLVPIYYTVSGLKTDVNVLTSKDTRWMYLMLVTLGISALRLGGFVLIAISQKMQLREGITLGLLMNTKGLLQMMILNIASDRKLIDKKAFTIMVLMTVFLTGLLSPLVQFIYKSTRGFISYKHRTLQKLSCVELRIVACAHMPRQVPAIINLLETSNPSQEFPIGVYALYLVELTGRGSSAILISNGSKKNANGGSLTRTQAQFDHIAKAFERFMRNSKGVYVQNLTSVSRYPSMHEDICNLAEEKRATLIILPFHKQQTVDGTMEISNPEHRNINENVLANAPCSVGILIDRGLSMTTSHHIVMLFFGGPDDREALTYALRMAEHPRVSLKVIRFVPGDNSCKNPMTNIEPNEYTVATNINVEREKKSDDDCIRKFRLRTVSSKSVVYTETVVNNSADTVTAIRSLDGIHNLFIVGRGTNSSCLTAGLDEWSEFPELGCIGDLLVTSEFGATKSVLVIQQYLGVGTHREEMVG